MIHASYNTYPFADDAISGFTIPLLEEGFDPSEEDILGNDLHSLTLSHFAEEDFSL